MQSAAKNGRENVQELSRKSFVTYSFAVECGAVWRRGKEIKSNRINAFLRSVVLKRVHIIQPHSAKYGRGLRSMCYSSGFYPVWEKPVRVHTDEGHVAQSDRAFINLFYSSRCELSVISIIDAWGYGYGIRTTETAIFFFWK
ncbi:hypothetical protein SDJN03_01465, partial [Cucurbita argyrosperma subsp. sororia]